jgi:hypothetical protein
MTKREIKYHKKKKLIKDGLSLMWDVVRGTRTKCTKCKGTSSTVIDCVIDGKVEEKLCCDCIENSGYCMGCGQFWGGISSFDFSSIPGYCPHCVDEINATCGESDFDYYDEPAF